MTESPLAEALQKPHPDARRRALHAIALFEAIKGFAALIASIGLLRLLHGDNDIRSLTLALLWRFHLDPSTAYPELLLHYADMLSAIDLRSAAPIAAAYIIIRLAEAYGLWKEKTWAEWLAALSGALYIPLEIAHLVHRTTLINATVLIANVGIVCFMAFQLWRRMHSQALVMRTPH